MALWTAEVLLIPYSARSSGPNLWPLLFCCSGLGPVSSSIVPLPSPIGSFIVPVPSDQRRAAVSHCSHRLTITWCRCRRPVAFIFACIAIGPHHLRSRNNKAMSFTKGDLLTKTRKLVNGLAKVKPVWLKAMEKSPPAVFPRAEKKVERICLPEDVYINKFYKKHPESLHEDPIKIRDFEPTPSRIFGSRVLELKEQGVTEEDAIDVADTEYKLQKKAKKKAYKRLKEIARIRGTKLPPNPYPSAVKEIQAEEKKYVHDRFFNPRILEIVDKLKEQQAAEMQDRGRPGGGF
ncbi:hypothetical protein L2E82_42920 [Cichorium intybus]|uniref:Uncharacterized protein n=1 Tax=Cichorium intybus TaxID=13427 RepID=A0ACB8ZMQ3_CICIN|nr:hypothetical protein L2E82_42920 [Cichorium intybus]